MALPLAVVVVIGVGWSGFWFYASSRAETAIAAWRARNAQAGRQYSCGRLSTGGYPFRIEVICSDPTVTLNDQGRPLSAKAARVHVAAQIYDPTLLIAEIVGPLTVNEAGLPPLQANWRLAQMSLRGRPSAPERLSVVFHHPWIRQKVNGTELSVLSAKHIEIQARVRTPASDRTPVLDVALELTDATAPMLHPIAAQPFDLSVVATLHGLDNLRPLPLKARLRQLQAAGGRLQITRLHVHQGDVTGVGAGNLTLNPDGRLNGELTMTVAGLDEVLPKLGIKQLDPAAGNGGHLAHELDKLDRLIPGLGGFARKHAGVGLAAGLTLIGHPADLNGKPALTLPLRFVDGVAYLGPVHLGTVRPLF